MSLQILWKVVVVVLIKESRFSYIRPFDGNTLLIVYNSSNTIEVIGIINRGSKIIIEVPNECMIIFTSETFHAEVKTYDRKSGGYLPRLRIFIYIVKQNYVAIRDKVFKMLNSNKYNINYHTFNEMSIQNIQYEGHIIKYLDTKNNIDILPIGKYYLGIWKRLVGLF